MAFRKLWYMSLEPYQGRYTLQLQDWNEAVFKRRGIQYEIVHGATLDNSKSIVVGQVLDAHGRSYYSMTQMARLVQLMREGQVTGEDAIFFEDMFTPGIESLPYIMDQIPANMRPKVYVRCLAQSIDPDDFVHVWDMQKWMGLYEKMTCEFATVLASNEEMVAHMKIAGWEAPIYNISGLAFGKDEVRGRIKGDLKPFENRTVRIGFAARWDQEKQPNFYMDLIEEWNRIWPKGGVEFAVFSGGPLRSNNESYMQRTRNLQERGLLKVYENLKKDEYYALLNDTRVLFNCALQDWVSNTVSEADTLGCNVLFPAYRSFPETFANDPTRLYIPWSISDAVDKLKTLIEVPNPNMGKLSDWTNGTIDRTLDIMEGKGEQWLRMSKDYRGRAAESKY
ncbi:MAG TPA: hypothetical protein VFM18_18700 [Methanosarcina sp.]|nr:hypothetical protein [Methanosarcina sp.]